MGPTVAGSRMTRRGLRLFPRGVASKDPAGERDRQASRVDRKMVPGLLRIASSRPTIRRASPMGSSRNLPEQSDSEPSAIALPPSWSKPEARESAVQLRTSRAPEQSISLAAFRELLGDPETQTLIRRVVRKRFRDAPAHVVNDIVQEANLAMVSSPTRPRAMTSARGWIALVTQRAVSAHFRSGKSEKEWLESTVDPGAEHDPDDADRWIEGTDPTAPVLPQILAEGWLISSWLAGAVANDESDAETFEMLLHKARTGETYETIAASMNMSGNALRKRVSAFKAKYEPRRRQRDRMMMLLFLLGAATVAIAVWYALRPARIEIRPDYVPPTPVHSSAPPKAAPSDTPFEPALPTRRQPVPKDTRTPQDPKQ